MWPGRPPARARTSRAAASTRSHGREEHGRVEVSLDGTRPDAPPALVERDAPVEADHVAARPRPSPAAGSRCRCRSGSRSHPRRAGRRGPVPTTARRTPRSPPARGRRPTSRTTAPRPRRRVPARRRRRRTSSASFSSSAVPHLRLAVHQRLRHGEVARRPPFDEVPRDRERAAAEADDGLVVPQLAPHDPDRLEDRRDASSGSGTRRRSTRRATGPARARRARRPRRARRRRPWRRPGS